MEHVQIRTAHNVDIGFEIAGVGDRVLAALFDYVLLLAYLLAMGLALGQADAPGWAFGVFTLPALLYFLLCEVFLDGQSVGKRARRIRVVRLDGRPATLGTYLLRWILRPIEILAFSGMLALICVLVTRNGQRLGDLAAGTTVVRLKPRVALSDTILAQTESDYRPAFPQAEHLTDADVQTVRDVLAALRDEGRTRTAHDLGARTKRAIERKVGVRSDLPPYEFLRTVLHDYNHLHGHV